MNNIFCISLGGNDTQSKNLETDFHGVTRNLHGGFLYLQKDTKHQEYNSEKQSYHFIGSMYNRNLMAKLAMKVDPTAYLANDAELMMIIYKRLGGNSLAMVEGDYCFIIDKGTDGTIVTTEPHGINRVHVLKASKTWITNSLKLVSSAEGNDALIFKKESSLVDKKQNMDTFTPIENSQALKPGTINVITLDTCRNPQVQCKLIKPISTSQLTLSPQKIVEYVDEYLNETLIELTEKTKSIGIPLSGGLDSSIITALSSKKFKSIYTYSIGTDLSNEFEHAYKVANKLGSIHKTKILSNDEIIEGVIKAIYHNEIFDGLSCEIQSGLFNIYKMAENEVKYLVTGYGADLLFGGILNPQNKQVDTNKFLYNEIYRTRWTGEFSTAGAHSYGIDVRHPFWRNSLINLCRNLNPHFKVNNNEVKNILREYACSLELLPQEIIRRKKTGIHEGSSVNKAFASILGTDTEDYKKKNLFTYRIFKSLMRRDVMLDDLTESKIRQIFNKEAI